MKINFLLCFGLMLVSLLGCVKDNTNSHNAEGYVYETDSRKPISGVPIYMSECEFTGTRCSYNSVGKTFTDANGHYKISARPQGRGSIYIEVGNNEKTFPSTEILSPPNKTLTYNFYVDKAIYVTARFVLQPLNRNFVQVSVRYGYYSAASAIIRNSTTIIDTTVRLKTKLNTEVRLEVNARNETNGYDPYSDSLLFTRSIGNVVRDTSVIW